MLAPPSTAQLFSGFLSLGMTAFGGALPLARAMVVERRGWLTAAEFTELLGLCQFMPGGNVINLSVAVGYRFRGARGAFAALSGLLAGPVLIVVALGELYARFGADPHVRHVFIGLAAAAAGLLLAMAAKLALPLSRRPAALVIAIVCTLAVAWWRWPLLPTMVGLTAVSLMLHWRVRR